MTQNNQWPFGGSSDKSDSPKKETQSSSSNELGDGMSFSKGSSPKSNNPYGNAPKRDTRPSRDGERKPFNRDDRDSRGNGDRKPYNKDDRGPRGNTDRKPFNRDDRGPRGSSDRKPFKRDDRTPRPSGDRKPFNSDNRGGSRAPMDPNKRNSNYRGRTPGMKKDLPPYLQMVVTLQSDKGREREGLFLAEGHKCVRDIFETTPEVLTEVFYVDTFEDHQFLAKLKASHLRVGSVSPEDFELIATTQSTQGIIAIARQAPKKIDWKKVHTVTLLDEVQDPGNMGAIFRTSLAFGMDAIVLGKGCVDPFNPKVVRGSSGTFLRCPFEQRVDLYDKIIELQQAGFTVLAGCPHASETLGNVKLKKKVAFIVGNEGRGIDQQMIDMASARIKIPMASNVESLNVSVAHGVMAWQLTEQRKNS
jgi:tRNA G18 (ribose-2'-O)-methylase SpoU